MRGHLRSPKDLLDTILFILAAVALVGNIIIVKAFLDVNLEYITNVFIIVIVGVIGDVALLIYCIYKFRKSIFLSLIMVKNGLYYSIKMRKRPAIIKKSTLNITSDISRWNQLKALEINKDATQHADRICKLFVMITQDDSMQNCLETVDEKKKIIAQMDNIEKKLTEIAENYCYVGNLEKCTYYMGLIHSNQNAKEQATLEEKCLTLRELRKKERKAFALWGGILVVIIALLVLISVFIKNGLDKPIHERIENQTLTKKMCEKDLYYNYFHSEKGYELLAFELAELHHNNDVPKAMWLLSVQPDCIDGFNVGASDSFIDWIVEYAKENGEMQINDNYETEYLVDDYIITLNSHFEYSFGHTFTIGQGKYVRSVERKSDYVEDLPTIE